MPYSARPGEMQAFEMTSSVKDASPERRYWSEVFAKLSKLDNAGPYECFMAHDSIHIKSLKNFIRHQSSLELEKQTGLPRRRLMYIMGHIKKMDINNDGRISKSEWEVFVKKERGSKLGGKGWTGTLSRVLLYAPTYSCSPPTLFLVVMTLIQIACYILSIVAPSTLGITHNFGERLWPTDSVLIYNPKRRYEAWRFISYMFLHGDHGHIGFNCFIQLVVGIPLEMSQLGWIGGMRVACLYISGVLLGSLGASVFQPDNYLLGASAGVYALIAAHLATLLINWREDGIVYETRLERTQFTNDPKPLGLNPIIRGFRLLFIVTFVVCDVGQIVYKEVFQGETSSTSYAGHVFGSLAGLMIGIFVLENRKVEDWERWFEAGALVIFGLILCALALWHIVYPSYFPAQDYSPLTPTTPQS
eukprot:snap_masked-scaffold231_size243715-processed-gene-1.20 protein:Tk10040 transcript:snap_masked-scaffold231_size243715-processed-gene-1.20-mRNA-1 annotation:"rhomboid-related protein 3"